MPAPDPYTIGGGQLMALYRSALIQSMAHGVDVNSSQAARYSDRKQWYFGGAIRSRLDQLTPPFKTGDIVSPIGETPVCSVQFGRIPRKNYAEPGELKEVKVCVYDTTSESGSRWLISLVEEGTLKEHLDGPFFEAEKFNLVGEGSAVEVDSGR
jgi:hypothetical protein